MATEESLGRLEAVAMHPKLRTAVSRVTFFHPMFHSQYAEERVYMRHLHEQIDACFRQRLGYGEWKKEERKVIMKALMGDCYPYSKDQKRAGLDEYCKQVERQKVLLQDPSYPRRVAIRLSQCPRVTSAYLVRRDPCGPHYIHRASKTPKRIRTDWLSTYHPEVLLELDFELGKARLHIDRAYEHFQRVVEAVALSKVQLKELATDEDVGFLSCFNWNGLVNPCAASTFMRPFDHVLDPSHLRYLHLTPATIKYEGYGQDWSACMLPLLARAPNIEELSIRLQNLYAANGHDTDVTRHAIPSFTELFRVVLPKLRELNLEFLRFRGRDFAHFLKNNLALEVLTLQEFHIEENGWKTAFDAIKHHPSIHDMELGSFRIEQKEVAPWDTVSTHHDGIDGIDYFEDLDLYLHVQEVEWTAPLAAKWGTE